MWFADLSKLWWIAVVSHWRIMQIFSTTQPIFIIPVLHLCSIMHLFFFNLFLFAYGGTIVCGWDVWNISVKPVWLLCFSCPLIFHAIISIPVSLSVFQFLSLRLYIVTWNVGTADPPVDMRSQLQLDSDLETDLYVIGWDIHIPLEK